MNIGDYIELKKTIKFKNGIVLKKGLSGEVQKILSDKIKVLFYIEDEKGRDIPILTEIAFDEVKIIKETTTTASITGVNNNDSSKSMVLKSMKDNYQYTLIEKLEKLTGKKVILEEINNNNILSLEEL